MNAVTRDKSLQGATRFPVWPGQRPFVLALSHDVDRTTKRGQFPYYIARGLRRRDVTQVRRQLRSLFAFLRGQEPYWTFPRIMAIEQKLDVRSTFFMLHETGRASLLNLQSLSLFWGRYSLEDAKIREMICELNRGGWEIGLHGSYYSYRSELLLRKEKAMLESALGQPVLGTRQHHLNIEIPETWERQARLGFRYDSTLGFTNRPGDVRQNLANRVGFPWGTSLPFMPKHPLTGQEIPILQIPLAVMDAPLMAQADPWRSAISLIDTVDAQHGVLTVNWHSQVFNPWEYPPCEDIYIRIIEECQQRGAWVARMIDVADWWQESHGN